MQLAIKNLGPISEGVVSLNEHLVIITGPNNTGKSYLTYLIHGISQHDTLTGVLKFRTEITKLILSQKYVIQAIANGEKIDLRNFITKILPDIFQIITSNTQENLSKIFASTSINANITIEAGPIVFSEDKNYMEYFSSADNMLNIITYDGKTERSAISSEYKDISEYMVDSLYVYIILCLDNILKKRTYFFPAERTAINLFAKHITSTKADIKDELDADVIKGLTDVELGRRLRSQVKAAPKYPYSIRDYINFVNNFKTGSEEGRFSSIAKSIENILAGGELYLDEFSQPKFIPKGLSSSLEIHLSSSLVKSLSYLILYLKYVAKEGDRVIIDEPELNLHPGLQISLARIIVHMVNEGLRVVISTHSDYLIKELNNLIQLNDLYQKEEHRAFVINKGYNEREIIDKLLVGAYFLQNGNIERINLDEDGLVVPTINDAIRRVDGLGEEIFMEMEG